MGKETWARRVGDDQSPSPADYSTRREPGLDSPRYTIKKRYRPREPGTHPQYRLLPTTVGDAPYITCHVQVEPPIPFPTPGPEFLPPRFADDYLSRNRATLSPRERIIPRVPRYRSYDHDPFGPAAHPHWRRSSDPRSPAYSIAPAIDYKWFPYNDNPSGAAYLPRHPGEHSPPTFTIHQRLEPPPEPPTPGPGEYEISREFVSRPLSVHPRHPEIAPFSTPGPSDYDVVEPTGLRSRRCAIRPVYSARAREKGAGYPLVPRTFDKPPGITIGPNHWKPPKNTNPGPQYISDQLETRGHSIGPRNGKSPRIIWIPKSDTPGPSHYRAEEDAAVTPRTAKWAFVGDNNTGYWIAPSFSKGPASYYPRGPGIKGMTIRPKVDDGPKELNPVSESNDAGYVKYHVFPQIGRMAIRPKEHLELIPK
jgi:hypothetical protein